MDESLDFSEELDIFAEAPCDSSKRIVMTKIFYCVHCEKTIYEDHKHTANNFSNHVRRWHPKKVIPRPDGKKWKAKEGKDYTFLGEKRKIFKNKITSKNRKTGLKSMSIPKTIKE
jgi:hypothetical protein